MKIKTENWTNKSIKDQLATNFTGEWGVESKPGYGNAFVLRATNLNSNTTLNYSTAIERKINPKKIADKKLQQGDIVLEASGGGPGVPVGRVAFFNIASNENYIVSNFFRTLRPNSTVVPKFLFWILHSLYSKSQIWIFQQQTTGIINLKFSEYINQRLLWPIYNEQKRIAAILDTIDQVIQQTETMIEKLKKTKAGLLHDLLTRGIDTNGQLRDPVAHPEQFKDSSLGKIPKDWNCSSLGKLCAIQGGFAFSSTSAVQLGIRWFKIANVGFGEVSWKDMSYLPSSFLERYPSFVLNKDDIVIAMTRPVLKGTLKVTKLSSTDVPSLLNQRVGRVAPKNSSDRDFLYVILRSFFVVNEIERKIFGTDPPNISSQQIESIEVPVPSVHERKYIAEVINKEELYIFHEQNYLDKMQKLKKGLMEDLLTGKISVANLPKDVEELMKKE